MHNLGQDVGKDLASAEVSNAAGVSVHVGEYLAVVRQPVSMKIVKSKLKTLITRPEMSTQQMPRVHVPSRHTSYTSMLGQTSYKCLVFTTH